MVPLVHYILARQQVGRYILLRITHDALGRGAVILRSEASTRLKSKTSIFRPLITPNIFFLQQLFLICFCCSFILKHFSQVPDHGQKIDITAHPYFITTI